MDKKAGARTEPQKNHRKQDHFKEDNRKPGAKHQPEKKQGAETESEEEKSDENNMYSTLNEQVGQLREQNKELTLMLQILQNNNNDRNNQPSNEIVKLRDQVAQAVRENHELKAMVDGIRVNKETDVRQQINDLQLENHDLRVEIGRLRYSQSRQKEAEPTQESETVEEDQLEEEPEADRTIFDKWPQVNWTELVNHLGSTGQGKKLEELGLALSQLLRDLWELNSTVFPSKDETNNEEEEEGREDPLKEIEQLLVSKWKELQGMVSLSKGYVSHHAEGMSRLLAGSMSKVYKAGVKALFGSPHKPAPSMDTIQPQLQKIMTKMGKVMTSLEEKWSKMKKKVGVGSQQKMDDVLEEAEYDEVEDAATQWLFQRAKDREQNRELSRSKFYEDWYTLRAKNRKRQRQEQDNTFPCKDPKKCKKNNRKYAEKPVVNNNEDDRDLPKHTFKESRGY